MKKSLFALLAVLVLSACGNDPEVPPPYMGGYPGQVGPGQMGPGQMGPGQMGPGGIGVNQNYCPQQVITDYNRFAVNCNDNPNSRACRRAAENFVRRYQGVSCVATMNGGGGMGGMGQTFIISTDPMNQLLSRGNGGGNGGGGNRQQQQPIPLGNEKEVQEEEEQGGKNNGKRGGQIRVDEEEGDVDGGEQE